MTSSSLSPEPPTPEPSRAPRSRRRRGEGPRLREEILDATERLLLQTGSADAVSIRSVADAVGVTPPSIYRHFTDKETLVAEVCARHFRALNAEIEAAVAQHDDPIERLVACGRAYIRFGMAHPEQYRILFMTRLDSVPRDVQQGWLAESDIFMGVVENAQACVDAGLLRPEHDDAYRVALGVWAQVHGLTSLSISKPFLGLEAEGFVEQYAAACLRGIVAE